jgi:uncharacterized protein (DUF2249 family)
MQTENGQDNKVVSIANRSPKTATITQAEQKQEKFSWEDVQRRNEENRQRLQKEREKANKGVIRSYRLKH